jgi:hypothetical protein
MRAMRSDCQQPCQQVSADHTVRCRRFAAQRVISNLATIRTFSPISGTHTECLPGDSRRIPAVSVWCAQYSRAPGTGQADSLAEGLPVPRPRPSHDFLAHLPRATLTSGTTLNAESEPRPCAEGDDRTQPTHAVRNDPGLRRNRPNMKVAHTIRSRRDQQNLSEIALTCRNTGAPNGIRTRAAALKGRCPRPLDDGGSDEEPP